MNNPVDRQGILDNLTAIETTAKLLVNAFVKKNNDTELSLNGVHREELINQTTTFLSQAQKLILNLSNTFNLTTDGFFQKSKESLNEEITSTPLLSDVSQNHQDNKIDSKNFHVKAANYSLSSVTLDDIIENRLTPKDLLPNYPLLHDSNPPNLVSLVRSLRSIENFDNLMQKAHTKIFNHEERTCCNYDGTNGKLPYPRHKRLLLDRIITLVFNERSNQTLSDDQRRQLYTRCEEYYSIESTLSKYRGVTIDQLNKSHRSNDEKYFICSLFRLVLSQDDIKRIVSTKNDLPSEWNDNQLCVYHTNLIHLLWIKQKWLERFPSNSQNEAEKWSQCINWVMESFLETKEPRPSKRKTKDSSTDQKRVKDTAPFEEKCKKIDRTKCNVLKYATQIIHFLSDENDNNLPTLKQLQDLEHDVFYYYWTPNQEKTWTDILDVISNVFPNEDFRQSYLKKLLETNINDQCEIERLLQIKL